MELEPFSSGGLSCCGLGWAAVNALKPIFAFCGNEWKGVSLFNTHFLSLTRLLIRVIWEDILKIVNSIITLPLSRESRECPPSRLVDAFSITFGSQVWIGLRRFYNHFSSLGSRLVFFWGFSAFELVFLNWLRWWLHIGKWGMSIRQHPVFDEEEKLHLRLATEIMPHAVNWQTELSNLP